MRLKKTLIAIMILLFTSLAVSVKIPELLNGNEEYNQLISDADKYNEKNLCKKAMDNYAQALSINDSLDLRLTMAKVYKKGLESGEYDSFYQYYEFLQVLYPFLHNGISLFLHLLKICHHTTHIHKSIDHQFLAFFYH